eukprot:TRINITY_DN13224_c0_g1_i1.p1 TRINITY_DN13224_c0_g1~~TRINITY_DN13224_c0_g1_i1.p1  ORF type:complete len:2730 (-),score=502.96 TRINITY_DN13224_c0_g1_i1:488-8677(-)
MSRRTFRGWLRCSEHAVFPVASAVLLLLAALAVGAAASGREEAAAKLHAGAALEVGASGSVNRIVRSAKSSKRKLSKAASADVLEPHVDSRGLLELEADTAVTSDGAAEDEENGVPQKLYVLFPGRTQEDSSGIYERVKDKTANGYPLWSQSKGGSHWLYSGLSGRWLVGGQREKELGFQCDTGVISSRDAHSGQMPHKLQEEWQFFDGLGWQQSQHIVIDKQQWWQHGKEEVHDAVDSADTSKGVGLSSELKPGPPRQRAVHSLVDEATEAAAVKEATVQRTDAQQEESLRRIHLEQERLYDSLERVEVRAGAGAAPSGGALRLGKFKGVNFNLILPRVFGPNRVFYLLDANGDGAIGEAESADAPDWMDLTKLIEFLPRKNRLLTDMNNIFYVGGQYLRIPTIHEARNVFINPQEPQWPTHWYWTSTRNDKGYHCALHNFPGDMTFCRFKDTKQLLVVLEVVKPPKGATDAPKCGIVPGGEISGSLNDYRDVDKMKKAGWQFSWNDDGLFRPVEAGENCSMNKKAYYGNGHGVDAEVSLTLMNQGTFSLSYGNCGADGNVEVVLNGLVIASVPGGEAHPALVSAHFTEGDHLAIRERDATLVIHGIDFACDTCSEELVYVGASCSVGNADRAANPEGFDCSGRLGSNGTDLLTTGFTQHASIALAEPMVVRRLDIFVQDGCQAFVVKYKKPPGDWAVACEFTSEPNMQGQVAKTKCLSGFPKAATITEIRIEKEASATCWGGGNSFQLAGVQIFGCKAVAGDNLALGKPVTMSTTRDEQSVGGHATDGAGADGAVEGLQCAFTLEQNPSFIRVDLGKEHEISHVTLVSSKPANGPLLSPNAVGWVVRVGNLGDNSDQLCAQNIDTRGGQPTSIYCQEPRPVGKQVTVWSATGIELCEIMVFGTEDSADEPHYPSFEVGKCPCGRTGSVFSVTLDRPSEAACASECMDWDNCVGYVFPAVDAATQEDRCDLHYKAGNSAGSLSRWLAKDAQCSAKGGRICKKKTPPLTMYARRPGQCARAPLKHWSDGSLLHLPTGSLGSVQACKDFCDLHWPDCDGFTLREQDMKCAWFKGACSEDDDLKAKLGHLTYSRQRPGMQCTKAECSSLCGCKCDCPCNNCDCLSHHDCPEGGLRTCCREKTNLALRKLATASSKVDQAEASKAVDGMAGVGSAFDGTAAGVCARTAAGKSFLQIDLGTAYQVHSFWFVGINETVSLVEEQTSATTDNAQSGAEGTAGSKRYFNLHVGLEGRVTDDTCAVGVTIDSGQWMQVVCGEPAPIGRYVTLISEGEIAVCEVEAYGHAVPTYVPDGLNIGEFGGVDFHLIKPYARGGKVYYHLDANHDSSVEPSQEDRVSLDKLKLFLDDGSQRVTDRNSILSISGYRLGLIPVPKYFYQPDGLILHARWARAWYWASSAWDDESSRAFAIGCRDTHFAAHSRNNPAPKCTFATSEKLNVGLELVEIPASKPLKTWYKGAAGESCDIVCGKAMAKCDLEAMRAATNAFCENPAKLDLDNTLKALYVDGLDATGCMSYVNSTAPVDDLVPFVRPAEMARKEFDECVVSPNPCEKVSKLSCSAQPTGLRAGLLRVCACESWPTSPTRYSVTMNGAFFFKRKLVDGTLAFHDNPMVKVVGVPPTLEGGVLYSAPEALPFGTISIAVNQPSKVTIASTSKASCGFDKAEWNAAASGRLALETQGLQEPLNAWEAVVIKSVDLEISAKCKAVVIVTEAGNVACADGTDDVNFARGMVVGCNAAWGGRQQGLAEGEAACQPGYHVCKTGDEVHQLGVSRKVCSTGAPQGSFYATRQGNSYDDIWGCGKDGMSLTFQHMPTYAGTLNVKLGDADIGSWRNMAANNLQEKLFVQKQAGSGGVMCCKTLPKDNSRPEWSRPSTRTWTDGDCPLISKPKTTLESDVRLCKTECLAADGCTAINWDSSGEDAPTARCELRACKFPVARPYQLKPGWRSFEIVKSTGSCPPVRGGSEYCSHGNDQCIYNAVQFEESCTAFCSRYDMNCLGESMSANSSAEGVCVAVQNGTCARKLSRHMCICEKKSLLGGLPPCEADSCTLGSFWCNTMKEAGFPDDAVCYVKASEDKTQWMFDDKPTAVAYGEPFYRPCDFMKFYCAGGSLKNGQVIGHAIDQAIAVKRAMDNNGRHPLAPTIKSPCVYDTCKMMRVSGAGFLPINGLYYPVKRDCNDKLYGEVKDGTVWPAYRNKRAKAFLTWDWRNSETKGWVLTYANLTRYYVFADQTTMSRVVPLTDWKGNTASMGVGDYAGLTVFPVPTIECVNLTLGNFSGNALRRFRQEFVVPMVPGAGIWTDKEAATLPVDLPVGWRDGRLFQLPWDNSGTYSFQANADVLVHVLIGCPWYGFSKREEDWTEQAAKELSIQGFKTSPERMKILADLCPLRLSPFMDVYEKMYEVGTTIVFTLTRHVHPALFVTLARPKMLDVKLLREDSMLTCRSRDALKEVEKSILSTFPIVSSKGVGAQAFASGSKRGSCSVPEAGDESRGCGTGPRCFCNINDGRLSRSFAWQPGKPSSTGKHYIGIRFPRKVAIHGMSISSQGAPQGFQIRQVSSTNDFNSNLDEGRYFYAADALLWDFAYPTEPEAAEVYRNGALVWSGKIRIYRGVDNLYDPNDYWVHKLDMRGERAETPGVGDWTVGDTVYLPRLMANPDGLRVYGVKKGGDEWGSGDMNYFPALIDTPNSFCDGLATWQGNLEWTHEDRASCSPSHHLLQL